MAMTDQYDAFVQRLDKSQLAVQAVVDWLQRKGRSVYVPETTVYPRGANPKDYRDHGDVFIDHDLPSQKRLEVKGLGVDFFGPESWPFREIFISRKEVVDLANGEVEAYVTVNKTLTCAAIILGNTKNTWYTTTKWASNWKQYETYYASPLENIIYRRISM
jgi:hypothetical protein